MPQQADIVAIYENQDSSTPVEYTFDLLFSTYGVTYKILPFNRFKPAEYNLDRTMVISYGREYLDTGAKKQIHIYASDFFGKDYLKPSSMPETPLKHYQGIRIIYSGHGDFDGWVRKSEKLIETNIDIIASSFFMVARYEEVIIDARDQYGRFPATASLAYKEGFLDKPVVNEYIELLWSWVDSFNLGFKRERPWEKNDFAVCLTHDMDKIKRYKFYPPLIAIRDALVQKHPKKACAISVDWLKTKAGSKPDPYDEAFDYIIDLEGQYRFTSSFYFMANDERYSLDDCYLKELTTKLRSGGFEVGIHPGFDAYSNVDVLKSQKERLERVIGGQVVGGRQHYLKWKAPESWRAWQAAGLIYDTTLGFADHEGFRCGICYPFQPFDLIENRVINLWEVPVIAMDTTLASYRGLSAEEGQTILANLLGTVEKYSGVFVLLWHNDYMCQLFTPEWKRCFEDFYHTISQKNAFVGSVSAVIESWENSTKAHVALKD